MDKSEIPVVKTVVLRFKRNLQCAVPLAEVKKWP